LIKKSHGKGKGRAVSFFNLGKFHFQSKVGGDY